MAEEGVAPVDAAPTAEHRVPLKKTNRVDSYELRERRKEGVAKNQSDVRAKDINANRNIAEVMKRTLASLPLDPRFNPASPSNPLLPAAGSPDTIIQPEIVDDDVADVNTDYNDIARHPYSQYALDNGEFKRGLFEQNRNRLNAAIQQANVAVPLRSTRQRTATAELSDRQLALLHLERGGRAPLQFSKDFLDANVFVVDSQQEATARKNGMPGCKVEAVKKKGVTVGYRIKSKAYLEAVAARRRLTQARSGRSVAPRIAVESLLPLVKPGFHTTLVRRESSADPRKLPDYVQTFKPNGGQYFATPMWLRRWIVAHPYFEVAYVDRALTAKNKSVTVYTISNVHGDIPAGDAYSKLLRESIKAAENNHELAFFQFRRNSNAKAAPGNAYRAERTELQTEKEVREAIASYREKREKAVERAVNLREKLDAARLIGSNRTCGYICFHNVGKVMPLFGITTTTDGNVYVAIKIPIASIVGEKAKKVNEKNISAKIVCKTKPRLLALPQGNASGETDEKSIADVVLFDGTQFVQRMLKDANPRLCNVVFETNGKLAVGNANTDSPIRTLDYTAVPNAAQQERLDGAADADTWLKNTSQLPSNTTSRWLYTALKFCAFWCGRIRVLARILNQANVNDEDVRIVAEYIAAVDAEARSRLIDRHPAFNPLIMQQYSTGLTEIFGAMPDRPGHKFRRLIQVYNQDTNYMLAQLADSDPDFQVALLGRSS